MSTTLIWAFVCLIIFVAVLAHPKLPNWMTFICMAPVVLLAKVMEAKDIYAVLNSSSLHLMIIICMFSGMIAATGLDIIIGDFVDHMTSSQTGKKKEMMIFAIVYLVSGLISTVLQNSYVALAFLPVLKSIARKNRISLSKLVLFVIFATTLGGAITLIGTPTNVYANTALEEAGLQLFGMLDFAWVGIPIFIVGGIYMIVMNRWCASYDDRSCSSDNGCNTKRGTGISGFTDDPVLCRHQLNDRSYEPEWAWTGIWRYDHQHYRRIQKPVSDHRSFMYRRFHCDLFHE